MSAPTPPRLSLSLFFSHAHSHTRAIARSPGEQPVLNVTVVMLILDEFKRDGVTYIDASRSRRVDCSVSQAAFNEQTHGLFLRSSKTVQRAMRRANVSSIALPHGSTRTELLDAFKDDSPHFQARSSRRNAREKEGRRFALQSFVDRLRNRVHAVVSRAERQERCASHSPRTTHAGARASRAISPASSRSTGGRAYRGCAERLRGGSTPT